MRGEGDEDRMKRMERMRTGKERVLWGYPPVPEFQKYQNSDGLDG